MLDLSFIEIAVILIAAVLILDAKDIPAVAKTVQGWFKKLKELSNEAKDVWRDIAEDPEIEEAKHAVKQVFDDNGKAYPAYDLDDIQHLLEKPTTPVAETESKDDDSGNAKRNTTH